MNQDHSTPDADAAGLVADLVSQLRLEQLDDDRFRGVSSDIGTRHVFGGQVLGQALMAASRTLPGRPVHSLHAYFLLPGDKGAPIDYVVERVRDGRSFGTRRVVAQQHGRTIFTLMASFQAQEEGAFSHQRPMPAAPAPEGLISEIEQQRALIGRLPAWLERWAAIGRPIEYRNVAPLDLLAPPPDTAETQIWMRAIAALPDDPALHCAILAYASDFGLLRGALRPHGLSFMQPNVRGASLDHAMWFHRDFRIDDWLLYCIDSPSAQGARALCRGEIYARDGRLVASAVQEGMIRVLSD